MSLQTYNTRNHTPNVLLPNSPRKWKTVRSGEWPLNDIHPAMPLILPCTAAENQSSQI